MHYCEPATFAVNHGSILKAERNRKDEVAISSCSHVGIQESVSREFHLTRIRGLSDARQPRALGKTPQILVEDSIQLF